MQCTKVIAIQFRNFIKKSEDDIYDDIDCFHLNQERLISFAASKRNRYAQKEVLSVRVDSDDEEDELEAEQYCKCWFIFTLNFFSLFMCCNLDEQPITSNTWGRKRRDFYGASYVDHDLGGVRDSEEEEMLELEEQDAIHRQRLLDSANKYIDPFDIEDAPEWEEDSDDEDEHIPEGD